MPYKKITELPNQFDVLPDEAKEIALNVINSVLDKGGDEESAFKQAWGAIKQSYKKNDEGEWVKMAEHKETVDIEGVEIMAVGTWEGYPETVSYTKKDLDELVRSYDDVSKSGLHEAPVKLGHDENQKLLQKDGYPAAGWVSKLRRVGKKLVADFKDVPAKIAEIISRRGYKKISSEIYFEKKLGDATYPLLLKAVSLLGGDIPAVKTLEDVRALYNDAGDDERVVVYSWDVDEGVVTLDEIMAGIDAILSKAEGTIKGKVGSPAIRTYLKEVKAKLKALMKSNNNSEVENEEAKVNIDNSIGPEGAGNDSENKRREAVMLKELIAELGLSEDISEKDALEAVRKLKLTMPQDGKVVSLEEHQHLTEQVNTLTQQLAEKDRDAAVAKAMSEGKITPATKETWGKLALENPALFAELMEKQPRVVAFAESGGSNGAEAVELTEAEREVAAKLGVKVEDVLEQKKLEKGAVS